jgi:predicted nucleotidyltransferase
MKRVHHLALLGFSFWSSRYLHSDHRIGASLLATKGGAGYLAPMSKPSLTFSPDDLRGRLRPFCEKHHILRLEVFGSAARGQTTPDSDVDLLVTLDESAPVSTADLLEMAGEAEELVGRPVDFVLRPSLEKSPNRFAREHILATAVCLYGN